MLMKKINNNKKNKRNVLPVAIPKQVSNRMGPVNIRREEFVSSFTVSSGSWALITPSEQFPGLDLNPANGYLFPWLSGIASMFEKYTFNSLEFEIVPGNSTINSGRYYMAFDYDWDDPVATNVSTFMCNVGAVEGAIWEPIVLKVRVDLLNQPFKERYVADVLRGETSQRLVYGGYLMLAAASGATNYFDLIVRYDVDLKNPCLPTPSVSTTDTLGSTVVGATSYMYPALSSVGPLLAVNSGTTAPVLTGLPYGSPALSVGNNANGSLDMTGTLVVTDKAPADLIPDTSTTVKLFNALGGLLATLPGGTATSASVVANPSCRTAYYSSNGEYVFTNYSLDLRALRALYPTLAYLAAFIYSGAGRTFATNTWNKVYKEL